MAFYDVLFSRPFPDSTKAGAGFKGSTFVIGGGHGDFGDVNERWEFVQKGFIPGWVDWQMKDPKGAADFLKKVIEESKKK